MRRRKRTVSRQVGVVLGGEGLVWATGGSALDLHLLRMAGSAQRPALRRWARALLAEGERVGGAEACARREAAAGA
jgi:hypothetical protein